MTKGTGKKKVWRSLCSTKFMGGGGDDDTILTLVGTMMTHGTNTYYKGAHYRAGGLLWNDKAKKEKQKTRLYPKLIVNCRVSIFYGFDLAIQ